MYQNGGVGWCSESEFTDKNNYRDKWKILLSKAYRGDASDKLILGTPIVAEPGSVCTETYLVVYATDTKGEAVNAAYYLTTKLARFLVLQHKPTQDAARSVYTFVPQQDFSVRWTDEMLYEKYGLSEEEINYVESRIKPREFTASSQLQ